MALGVEVVEMGWDLSKIGYGQLFNPVLGFNLEGRKNLGNHSGTKLVTNQALTDMEHDLEDGVLIGEEGKKRARREMGDSIGLGDENISARRNKRLLESNQFLSAAAKRQADRAQ
ncbi:hypothetical protein J1N35_044724 [Gossypium stocksii]|uniref:Uncharacterized protein n=1 Tax=Gossypium stocksii TaxID=47602 RepID=A0A9D3U9X9_9ROSI|nr:hypothetical protein J1N35_044724 [Gossypium stocksii]